MTTDSYITSLLLPQESNSPSSCHERDCLSFKKPQEQWCCCMPQCSCPQLGSPRSQELQQILPDSQKGTFPYTKWEVPWLTLTSMEVKVRPLQHSPYANQAVSFPYHHVLKYKPSATFLNKQPLTEQSSLCLLTSPPNEANLLFC